ncbi:outer membrane lipoprotein chaperone LolA [Methylibium rhizosphaerae]|uniref:outer membrane lipoprotein chaperone LolA n=1 Tax=Methylibium rhizosphaerae TaxID=2570323 RepID=UPI0011298CE0|nr:outer membrane lipoprotein chaperone LolA [Methylibium rhizosphaerae]
MKRVLLAGALLFAGAAAHADAIDTLKAFVSDVKTGRASFTQVVTSPDGAKKKSSNGSFEFARPNRFRFAYAKPYEQLIVGDGQKIWLHDPDLNQVTVRPMGEALGSTPAALLAGSNLDKDFTLKALPDEGGLQWVLATPRQKDSGFQSVKVAFRAKQLAAVEIVDSFGQRSRLDFTQVEANASLPADRFRFTPPPGADVLSQ